MNKWIIALVVGIVSTFGVLAQSGQVDRQLAPLKQTLASGAQLVTFGSTTYDARGGVAGELSGRLYLQGGAFRLETPSIVAVCVGGALRQYDKTEHVFTTSQLDESEAILLNPITFVQNYGRSYTARLLPETKVGPVVGFAPRKRGTNLKGIELQLDRSGKQLRQVVIVSVDGYRTVMRIEQIETIKPREQSFYVLQAKDYPGAEVVSLD